MYTQPQNSDCHEEKLKVNFTMEGKRVAFWLYILPESRGLGKKKNYVFLSTILTTLVM